MGSGHSFAPVSSRKGKDRHGTESLRLAPTSTRFSCGDSVSNHGRDTSLSEQLRPVFGDLHRFAVTTYRQAKRLVILLVGGTVLAVGLAMILLPGPAVLVIPLGLAILAVEFAWARRWLVRMHEKAQSLRSR